MTTDMALQSFMRDLLEKVEESEIVTDNAITPTRSLRARHQRRLRPRKTKKQGGRSTSASPSVLNRKTLGERRSQWQSRQEDGARTYSFESPVRKKAPWAAAEKSPNSVTGAFFSPLSPKSARWSPQAAAFLLRQQEGWDPVSPKSARWRVQPSLVRQESDSFLVCPERAFDSLPVVQLLQD
eukprot:CAMPEP_0117083664 /NCGR_PEP_ID=MMETSP0472-20121206/58902_1 /TAXON_ID=693140 ORGANISM="Tiarina fusus, Strain LIS" /NCGR_SAMPLE_ID=MMETSP0472 /ASSEMBLY_ACC=CAM_ASM_000603 /LENGTH=181 /DNA_ID=CAMNT_0004812375 /DNA_START=151 /DNA_END=696 /DNA_ORIENTATION=-